MPAPASQPTRASARETRQPERFRHGNQQEVRRRLSPPPSPPREEIAVVAQPGVERVAAVRLEVIGVGEEEEILEIAEALGHGGGLGEEAADEEEEEAVEAVDEELGQEGGAEGAGEEALLNREARRVRGVEDEQRELADRLDPEVPDPLIGPPLLDGDGWREIDRLGAWECALNTFSSMEEVPFAFRVSWGKAVARVLTSILGATSQEDLDRALKWWLIMPAALLRQARRGGQNGRGRAEVAGRFRAVAEDNWDFLITSLTADKTREERRRRAEGQRAELQASSK